MKFYNLINNSFCVLLTRNINVINKKLIVNLRKFATNSNADTSSSTMKVLNVAEKNDAAKNIANILSRGTAKRREGLSKYNKIYEFSCNVLGQNLKMAMTSVSGHLLNWEFSGTFRGWQSCQPVQLFDAPVFKSCPDEYAKKIKETLEKEVKFADTLILWTDCDREGENIAFEILGVCTAVKPNIRVFRAKFSEITAQSIWRAIERLDQPNKLWNDAVDVRSELDLRIGAAFTRFQTLRLKRVFPEKLADCLISYGSCQFPTLGFVVERYNQIQNFVPEDFWKIRVDHKIDELTVEFVWKRVRLFDREFCRVLYEQCLASPLATVEKVVSKPKSKWRPVPLDTIEFEKIASKKLGINAKEAMRIAEKLYTQGCISYPRTETNIFPKQLNLNDLVQQQVEDPNWGGFAARVMDRGPNPRQGKKSDEAHPPIHPTKYVNNLAGNEKKVYDFIVRRFLACVSDDAKGHETIVDIVINKEKFVARGLMILERNYLEVYPYEKWSDKEIHIYQEGQTFHPTSISMVDGKTSAPNLLTEADLIALMEKHGIGTDATHAEHIETIKKRLYVGLNEGKYFVPGQLGMGLVEGYDNMGFAMSKPHLRAELEADLKKICEGSKAPDIVLKEQIQKYKQVFIEAQTQVEKIDAALGKYLEAAPIEVAPENIVENAFSPVFKCPSCGLDIILRKRDNAAGNFYLSCTGFPHCKCSMWFPSTVQNVELAPNSCPEGTKQTLMEDANLEKLVYEEKSYYDSMLREYKNPANYWCGPNVKQLKFNVSPGAVAPYYPNSFTSCVNCDRTLLNLLHVRKIEKPDNTLGNAHRQPTSLTQPNNQSADRFQQTQQQNNRPPNRTPSSSNNNWRGTSGPTRNDNQNDGDTNGEDVRCNCRLPAKRLIVQKENMNKGRPFYKCGSDNWNEGCNFFQWADVDDYQRNNSRPPFSAPRTQGGREGNNGGRRRAVEGAGRGGSGSQRKCGICHQTGHTRRNCPNE